MRVYTYVMQSQPTEPTQPRRTADPARSARKGNAARSCILAMEPQDTPSTITVDEPAPKRPKADPARSARKGNAARSCILAMESALEPAPKPSATGTKDRAPVPPTDMMSQVRSALRAAERAEWIGNVYEIRNLQEQVEVIRCRGLPSADMDAELELIVQQLQQKAARDRQKAAKATNADTFACCVCMDRLPLDHLRVNAPCGHGFCKACIGKPTGRPTAYHGAHAVINDSPPCFTCRAAVASVLHVRV